MGTCKALILALILAVCQGRILGKRLNGLIEREKAFKRNHGENAAKSVLDYDEMLERQEEHDLFFDDYNDDDMEQNDYGYNEDVANDQYIQQNKRKKQRKRFSAKFLNGGDDGDDGDVADDADDGEQEDDDEETEDSSDSNGAYSEKEQLTAFLLSFFLGGVGAGRFYVGDYAIASLKLCLPLIALCVACVVGCFLNEGADDGSSDNSPSGFLQRLTGSAGVGAAIASCGCCAWQIWWLVDWILFAMNEIPDAEGKTLYPM